MVANIHCD